MTREEFRKASSKRILLLDGATGSELRRMGMPVGVCVELWACEHPEITRALQSAYVDAGSDIIYAPTFSANRLGLRMHGLEDRLPEINAALVDLSRSAAGENALVAGDMTTTGKPLEPVGAMTYHELFEVYREQAEVMFNAGVDLIVGETMLGIDETTCCVEAVRSVCDLPVMCTLTVEADGHLLFGGTIQEAAETLQAVGADAVGINCSVGPDQLESVISNLRGVMEIPIIAKPNAGMPVMDEKGQAHYNMSPEAFTRAMSRLIDAGARIVGGCCGTNPDYIRALSEMIRQL